jgi:hypothetical protein
MFRCLVMRAIPNREPLDHSLAYYRGRDMLKMLTSSLASLGLTQDRTYTRWGSYVATKHNGEFTRAAGEYRRSLNGHAAAEIVRSTPREHPPGLLRAPGRIRTFAHGLGNRCSIP